MPDSKRPADWFRFARQDLTMAELALRQSEPLYEPACFHAQQAAEKGLKGFLISRRHSYPKTHDLARLLGLVQSFRPAASRLGPDAEMLTQYAGEGRYPDVEHPAITREDAEAALAAARRIVKAVMPAARPSRTGR